ncbi:hypothetical protein BHE74_00009202 [Ensete ventricosum]|nr:hypothetical protein BHE74_00009202 [Ensete ventricosum]
MRVSIRILIGEYLVLAYWMSSASEFWWGVPTLPVPGRLYDNWRPPYDRSATCVGLATSAGQLSEDGTSEKDDPETGKLAKRSKRTSKSVGLSSFVSRKKKIKKETTSPSEQ